MPRIPAKLTITATCCTVLAAGAAAGTLTLNAGGSAAQPSAAALSVAARATDVSHSGTTASVAGDGLAISDFETQHARSTAVAGQRASELAVRAQARAAARAARARAAARQAARQRAAAQRAAAQRAAVQPAASSAPAAAAPASAVASGSPQQVAMSLLSSYGWSSSQFSCLDELWTRESGWNPTADNTSSGAYGIPQALPGSKMASAGPDWQTDATTQIKWGLGYIKSTYGSPCGAWSHEESAGWY